MEDLIYRYMKKLLFLVITSNLFAYSQNIIILNKDTKQPINNVSAFDENGKIINISNNKGCILLESISNVELFHPDYEKLNLETNKKDTVYLIPSITLSDVIINVKNNEYIHIYSYFYSYQLIDDFPQAFTDGIIVYTINKKNKLISQDILKNRSLKNRPVINDFYSKNKGATFNIGSEPPPFSFKEELIVNNIISLKNNKLNVLNKKANIYQNDNIINLNINYVEKDKPLNKSLFGLKSSIMSFNISESFSNSNNFKFQNLKSIQKFYNSKISQKKLSYDYKLIQNISVLKIKSSNEKFKEDKEYDDVILNKYLYLIPENISKIIYENILN